MDNNYRFYNFKGTKQEIVNSILSLLFGKEFYNETSFYTNFVNEFQPERQQKKMKAILDLMQKENLILLRDRYEDDGINVLNNLQNTALPQLNQGNARVYLRQRGKNVLCEGGYKISGRKKEQGEVVEQTVPLRSILAILLILIAAVWFMI